jgi:alkylation response protein AidB-like acyl-CoA dehydrogenase
MNFKVTPQEEALRQEVRDFMKEHPLENYPCALEEAGYGYGGFSREFSKEIGTKKWVGIAWPKQYGGLGRSLMDMFILKDELALHLAPMAADFFAETVGFSILAHGTEEQKQEFLPSMARGELVWATGLSEPEAGSDLFGMKTTAVKKGDYFVINGNKVWNAYAHLADWLLVAAITDPNAARKSQSMGTFLVHTSTPGLTIRTVEDMSTAKSFNELFFDEVKVAEKYLLGSVNSGFAQIMESLEGDRFWARVTRPTGSRIMLDLMVKYCKETKHNGVPLSEDPVIRDTLAELAVEIEVCRGLAYNCISLMDKGINLGLTASYEQSYLKIFADELGRKAANVWMQILGPKGLLWRGSKYVPFRGGFFEGLIPFQYLFSFALPLAGGTTQMQRQTIALRGLGLPRS